MSLIKAGADFWKKYKENKKEPQEDLLEYLLKLKKLEARLWGVTINDLVGEEEQILEDTNHLIYIINHRKENEIKATLKVKEVKDFLTDIKKLQEDFLILKNMVRAEDRLKRRVSEYSVRLVSPNKFNKLKNMFILVNQLYDVLDVQDEMIKSVIRDVRSFKFDTEQRKLDVFLDTLYKLRTMLAGHMEHHKLWEEDREGYSNTSNIISALIIEVKEDI